MSLLKKLAGGGSRASRPRLRQAHALYEQYREAGVTILKAELLD
jgi:hypothetical protein